MTRISVFFFPLTHADFPIQVSWHTEDDTALAGIDYLAASGVATIPAGQTSTTFFVAVLPDTEPESTERFKVVFDPPSFGEPSNGPAYVDITNARIPLSLPPGPVTFPEPLANTATYNIPIKLKASLKNPVVFHYSLLPGTATADDFIAGDFSVTVPAGSSTLMLPVTVKSDDLDETTESFSLNLFEPAGFDINGAGTLSLPLLINDGAVAGLSRRSFSASQATALNQPAPGLLMDNTGGYTRARVSLPPDHGTVVMQPGGGFIYTSHPNFIGADRFTIQAITSDADIIGTPDAGTWHWLHPLDGIDPGNGVADFQTDWKNVVFDDSRWNTGSGLMAYGVIGTGAGAAINTPIGIPPSGLRYSAYFRRAFTSATSATGPLTIEFVCDDAAIFYLNGTEAGRFGKEPLESFATAADTYKLLAPRVFPDAEESAVQKLVVNTNIPSGPNLLAVSIHNQSVASSDLGFRFHSLYTGTWSEPVWMTVTVSDFFKPPVLTGDAYVFPALSPAVDSRLNGAGGLFENDGLFSDSGVFYDPVLEVATGGQPAGPVTVDPASGHFRIAVPSGFFGHTAFTYRVRDKDGWSTDVPVAVDVNPSTPLDEWRFTAFGQSSLNPDSSPFADPDKDGLANIFEFLNGSSPLQISTTAPLTVSATASGIVLEIPIRTAFWTGIALTLEASEQQEDPAAWRPLAVLREGIAPSFLATGVTWTATGVGAELVYKIQTGFASAKGFYRLRATVDPPWWTL